MPLKNPSLRRPYTEDDVIRLRGPVHVEHTLARQGAEKLRQLLGSKKLQALGALTGNQAVQQVKAGLRAIYLSGWQVAADANTSGQMYPDQSLYPVDSVPNVVRRVNSALIRAGQIEHLEGKFDRDWMVPIVADAEAGFGGPLNVFELTKALIEAGAAAVHLEDQLSSEKKCGHLGGKVLVPTNQAIRSLVAARLAADVLDVPTVIIARTDALGATLLTSDIDYRDQSFLRMEEGPDDCDVPSRTDEGFYRVQNGMALAVSRALAYAPYADMLWCETSTPDLGQAREFAAAVHKEFPGKWLAYNCSPSFNWKKFMGERELRGFQDELAEMGYRFQFITLAGFHALNYSMFNLASHYAVDGMAAYSDLQQREIKEEEFGYTAVKHQREVGTGYFDAVAETVSGGRSSTLAMEGSTESQFKESK